MEILVLSLLTATSLLVILTKIIGFHNVLKYQKIIDAVATFGLPWIFFGSFSGMATAIIAGVTLSIFLGIIGKFYSIRSLI